VQPVAATKSRGFKLKIRGRCNSFSVQKVLWLAGELEQDANVLNRALTIVIANEAKQSSRDVCTGRAQSLDFFASLAMTGLVVRSRIIML